LLIFIVSLSFSLVNKSYTRFGDPRHTLSRPTYNWANERPWVGRGKGTGYGNGKNPQLYGRGQSWPTRWPHSRLSSN